MNFADKAIALAQIGLAFLFALGFFALLFVLMFLNKAMTTTEVTILTGLLSVLGTLVTQQQGFFFQRTRPPALPEPPPINGTTTTTTVTAPAKSVTGVEAHTTITPTAEVKT